MYKPILIWVVALAMAVAAFSQSFAAVAHKSNPVLATASWLSNGFAHQSSALDILSGQVQEGNSQIPEKISKEAVRHAREAFRLEPAASEALAIIALSLEEDSQARLMEKTAKLSLRNQLVAGWMIIEKGKQDDLDGVLNYYDISLRGNSAARDALLPTMAASLQNKKLVEPLRNLLSKNPPWAEFFWIWVARSPQSIENAAKLRIGLAGEDIPKGVFRDKWLVEQLAVGKKFREAKELRAELLPALPDNQAFVKNSSFDRESTYPPLDWELISNGDFGAGLNPGAGTLELSAVGGSNGRFVRQLVELPSRKLRLNVRMTETPNDSAIVTLRLSCADESDSAIAIRLEKAELESILDLTSADCDFYWLDIEGRTADDSEGFDVSFDSITISPRSETDGLE